MCPIPKNEYKGRTCISGDIYAYFKEMEPDADICEFDFLINKELKFTYDGDFKGTLRRALSYSLSICGVKDVTDNIPDLDSAKEYLEKIHPAFLAVQTSLLKYDEALNFTTVGKHMITVCESNEDSYYIADCYWTNPPRDSYYGWADKDMILKAWEDMEFDSFRLEKEDMDLSRLAPLRQKNLKEFLEGYLEGGLIAKRKLCEETLNGINEENCEEKILALNKHFRIDGIIGVMLLLGDYYRRLGLEGEAGDLDALTDRYTKTLLTCLKMSFRHKTDKLIMSLEEIIGLTFEEKEICEGVLEKLSIT